MVQKADHDDYNDDDDIYINIFICKNRKSCLEAHLISFAIT